MGINVEQKPLVSIGGGMGSFAWVDALRIHGVPANSIAVIGGHTEPYYQFKTYCDNSGLLGDDHVRSDSASRIDSLWGFPGYAVSEIGDNLKQFAFAKALSIAWQIFSEPIFSDFYTPQAKRIYEGIEKEMKRISWNTMIYKGIVLNIQKTDNGRFAIDYKNGTTQKRIIANIVHLALGHTPPKNPALSGSVSVYEPHNHLLTRLKSDNTVLVVGRGIAAARVIERLLELREKGKHFTIASLFRDEGAKNKDKRDLKRKTLSGWNLQYFNWPRSAFGGEIKEIIEESTQEKRMRFMNEWGLVTTAPRKKWMRGIMKALHGGYYTVITNPKDLNPSLVIDCTGFSTDVSTIPLYKKLLSEFSLDLTPAKTIVLNNFFEIEKVASNNATLFVTGAAASGNQYGPVDSFLGLQYAALKSIEKMQHMTIPVSIKPLSPLSSFIAWIKWMKGQKI